MPEKPNTPFGTPALAEVFGDLLERALKVIPPPKPKPAPNSDDKKEK